MATGCLHYIIAAEGSISNVRSDAGMYSQILNDVSRAAEL